MLLAEPTSLLAETNKAVLVSCEVSSQCADTDEHTRKVVDVHMEPTPGTQLPPSDPSLTSLAEDGISRPHCLSVFMPSNCRRWWEIVLRCSCHNDDGMEEYSSASAQLHVRGFGAGKDNGQSIPLPQTRPDQGAMVGLGMSISPFIASHYVVPSCH